MAIGEGGGREPRGGQERERRERRGKTCQTVARQQKAVADAAGRRTCDDRSFFSLLRARRPAMSKKSRGDALDDISTWDTEAVLCLLRKVSEARRDPLVAIAPYFAPFRNGAVEGKSRERERVQLHGGHRLSKARRDRDNVSEHRGAGKRERERETRGARARQRW